MVYRLKHVPTGLYYQPHKHRGSNLSKRGKIYQTASHGLSSALRHKKETFNVYVENNSVSHKLTKEILDYKECSWTYNQLVAETKVSDWVIEELQ